MKLTLFVLGSIILLDMLDAQTCPHHPFETQQECENHFIKFHKAGRISTWSIFNWLNKKSCRDMYEQIHKFVKFDEKAVVTNKCEALDLGLKKIDIPRYRNTEEYSATVMNCACKADLELRHDNGSVSGHRNTNHLNFTLAKISDQNSYFKLEQNTDPADTFRITDFYTFAPGCFQIPLK